MQPIAMRSPWDMTITLIPQHIDNGYRGHKLALWFFALLVLMNIAMSLNCIFNGYFVAVSADGAPLDALAPAGAQTVVSLFATWGLEHFVICLLCILVLMRYRSMIPFMFALLLLEDLSRKLILHFLPMVRNATSSGSFVNLLFLAFICVGLVLSLRNVRLQNPGSLGKHICNS